jgi:hypothetical protein
MKIFLREDGACQLAAFNLQTVCTLRRNTYQYSGLTGRFVMASRGTAESAKKVEVATARKPGNKAKPLDVLPNQDLESKVLQVLSNSGDGLTIGELSKKCGIIWWRGLALKLGIESDKPRTKDVQRFVYELWVKGSIFSEPPTAGKKACRFWSLVAARMKFPKAYPNVAAQIALTYELSTESLRRAYDKFVPEHLGGFVPIYKVRRHLGVPREAFDSLIKGLNEKDEPVLELLGGDPQKFTEDQKQDSLWRGDNLFLRMRWRES